MLLGFLNLEVETNYSRAVVIGVNSSDEEVSKAIISLSSV